MYFRPIKKPDTLKSTIHILLVALLLLQAGGALVWCQAEQWHQRWQQMELVASANAPQVSFHLSEQEYLKVKKGSDELLMNGKMYDVRSVADNSGTIDIVAICDGKEDDIICKIEKLLKQGSGDKKSSDKLIELLSLFYVGSSCPINYYCYQQQPLLFGSMRSNVLDAFFAVSAPPPWVI